MLLQRIDHFLGIAHSVGIKVLLVLFDGVWNPEAALGRQLPPIPGVHNSRWLQSPPSSVLARRGSHATLEPYVTGVIRRFRNDHRILGWDLYNEPDNPNHISYGRRSSLQTELAPELKARMALQLMEQAFAWARAAGPSQPLTVGVWIPWPRPAPMRNVPAETALKERLLMEKVEERALKLSDVISFHHYGNTPAVVARIAELRRLGNRPIWLTEFMARPRGSTFNPLLDTLRKMGVSSFCWGLVAGKTQTIYPWSSWKHPVTNVTSGGQLWFHDVLTPSGQVAYPDEAAYIRQVASTSVM